MRTKIGVRNQSRKDCGGTATTYFVYDESGHLLGEYNGAGTVTQETIYLGDMPVGIWKGGARYYVHADHLNTPRAILDQNGIVIWLWKADPFGTTNPTADPDANGVTFAYNLRFPGQYYDQETGMFYNYFRDYDPKTGRYVESDPIGLGGGLNTFGYVGGNPISTTDPTGEFGLVGAGIGAGVEVAIQAYGNYKKGCDVLDPGNYDWTDVGVSAAVGALAPGWFSVGKTTASSGSAISKLAGQLSKARTENRASKIRQRIENHGNKIAEAIVTQSGYQAGKAIAKDSNGEASCECGK